MKYLVQTRDDVEAGSEQLQELTQEMQEIGLYDTSFELGDLLEESQEEEHVDHPESKPKQHKKRVQEFPVVEGEETTVEYVGQFKKACLTRKALLKSTKDRLEKDKSTGHQNLECISKS